MLRFLASLASIPYVAAPRVTRACVDLNPSGFGWKWQERGRALMERWGSLHRATRVGARALQPARMQAVPFSIVA